MPVARHRARAPAMFRPWVEVLDRSSGMLPSVAPSGAAGTSGAGGPPARDADRDQSAHSGASPRASARRSGTVDVVHSRRRAVALAIAAASAPAVAAGCAIRRCWPSARRSARGAGAAAHLCSPPARSPAAHVVVVAGGAQRDATTAPPARSAHRSRSASRSAWRSRGAGLLPGCSGCRGGAGAAGAAAAHLLDALVIGCGALVRRLGAGLPSRPRSLGAATPVRLPGRSLVAAGVRRAGGRARRDRRRARRRARRRRRLRRARRWRRRGRPRAALGLRRVCCRPAPARRAGRRGRAAGRRCWSSARGRRCRPAGRRRAGDLVAAAAATASSLVARRCWRWPSRGGVRRSPAAGIDRGGRRGRQRRGLRPGRPAIPRPASTCAATPSRLAESEAHFRELAHTDPLTGLANRRGLLRALQRGRPRGGPPCVLLGHRPRRLQERQRHARPRRRRRGAGRGGPAAADEPAPGRRGGPARRRRVRGADVGQPDEATRGRPSGCSAVLSQPYEQPAAARCSCRRASAWPAAATAGQHRRAAAQRRPGAALRQAARQEPGRALRRRLRPAAAPAHRRWSTSCATRSSATS